MDESFILILGDLERLCLLYQGVEEHAIIPMWDTQTFGRDSDFVDKRTHKN